MTLNYARNYFLQPVSELLTRISNLITEQSLCTNEGRILVAISGGPDSVFLAYVMQELGYQIGLAHINYQLRGAESDQEETLVRNYAKNWGVPLFVKSLNAKELIDNSKDSLQEVARRIRYDFFEETMDKSGFVRCALAHQADDQTEQVMLSLLTGNAAAVLQQIPVKRERYIRPLLVCTREEILEGLANAGLSYATDSSNLKNDYLRNRVRNRILPLLREVNPNADEQLRRKQELYISQNNFLTAVMDRWVKSCLLTEPEDAVQILDWRPFVDTWGKEHLEVFIAHTLGEWGLHGHSLWQGVRLVDAQVGKKLLVAEKTLLRIRNGLQWGKLESREEAEIEISKTDTIQFPIAFEWKHRKIQFSILKEGKPLFSSKKHFYLNLDQVKFPLTLRSWREGDYMQPLGMAGHKKLSDIFVDEKYTTVQKQEAFVLEDREKVLLLSDFRIADAVRLTDQAERILVVELL